MKTRRSYTNAPPVDHLPLQPKDYPRLFSIALYAARAAGVLPIRITKDGAGHFNFVFDRAGQLITCQVSRETLVAANDTPIIRAMAVEIMGKVK